MSIIYESSKQQFHIKGIDFSYVCHVDHHGYLIHDYYGKGVKTLSSGLVNTTKIRSWSPTPIEDDKSYGHDSALFEYGISGHTDFRVPALMTSCNDGDLVGDFTYSEHRIFSGKSDLNGLPSTYGKENEVTTLEIVLIDHRRNQELILSYVLFEKTNAMTRSVKIQNNSDKTMEIKKIMGMCLDYEDSNYEMLQLSGAWARERHIVRRELVQGIQSVGSNRGASSHVHNPFVALMRPGTTEDAGEIYGYNHVYSGNFICEIEVSEYNLTRVIMGISSENFTWVLEPSDVFTTPEIVMVYSCNGIGDMSRTYHDLYNNHLIRGKYQNRERPILINNWEATYFDFTKDKLVDLARASKGVGIELFVLDDGWFGNRNDDSSSLGDWTVNEEKLGGNLESLVSMINNEGLEFGLWFEPEMVSPNSKLYESHPDWCIHCNDARRIQVRNQLILDLSRSEVCDYIIETLTKVLNSGNVSYVKWDMNRNMTDINGERAHRYILGLYKVMDTLINRYPHILFEGCAGGGGRFDPGILYYMPQIWTSDDTDAIERLSIQYGTSIVYPPSSMGGHVSAVPNHQVGRITPIQTRAHVAMYGNFGYELDTTGLSEEELKIISLQVLFYKKHRVLLQYGSHYRLTAFNQITHSCWMKVSKDKRQCIVTMVKIHAMPNGHETRIKLKGLDENRRYRIVSLDTEYGGDELMNIGIEMPKLDDFESVMFYIEDISLQ